MNAPAAEHAPDVELANAIRALAMDAVEAAKSGHPGMPMGMAEIAVALWNRHLRHNPANPHWPNRDRFILSNDHGSILQDAVRDLRPFHSFERPRLDVAIRFAASDRLRPADGRTAQLPPIAFEDTWTPGG